MHKREGNPLDVAAAHLVDVLQSERARGEVSGVGIRLVVLHVEDFEVLIGNDGFAAYHHVPFVRDFWENARDGGGEVRDVGARVSISARDHLR